MTNPETLLALFDDPAGTGRRAVACRRELFGRSIWIREGDAPLSSPWPTPASIPEQARVAIAIEPTDAARRAYAVWLLRASTDGPQTWTLAPSATATAGLHPLWCIAVARLALPPGVRIEARHDLLSIRLAQIALGFGADTFSGPILPDRKLPLAGMTRPSENTPLGIATLIEQAGFDPTESP